MIDHISLHVRDFEKSKAFFLSALQPFGYALVMEFPETAGLGAEGKADFWITSGEVGPATHIAFTAQSRERVDEFYKSALVAGGKDNGEPGLRPQYHEHYYAAFVEDPDGNNIEAVCHRPLDRA